MKRLILWTLTLLAINTWALTEVVENTSNGRSHIDPVNEIARINILTNLQNPNYRETPPRIECKKIKVVRREANNRCIETQNVADPAQTCESLRTSIQGFIDCEEVSAAVVVIGDAQKCGTPPVACQTSSTRRPYTLDLPIAGHREKIRECSPDHELLVVTDSRGQNAAVSSLKDPQQCGRNLSGFPPNPNACAAAASLRHLDTGNVLWDQQNRAEYRINVGHTPGFYIGDHAHYFFDYSKRQWCYQHKPFQVKIDNNQRARTTATCVSGNVPAHPIEFTKGSEHMTLGIVRLEVVNGQPVATVGQPTAERDQNGRYQLDTSRAVMRMTLSSTEASQETGRRSTFELLNPDGTRISHLTVSPTMALGDRLNTPEACRSTPERYCLNVPVEVSGPQSTGSFCRNNTQSIPLSNSSQGACYSCNGITPGACDQNTHLIQKTSTTATQPDAYNRIPTSYSGLSSILNTCYNGAPASTTPAEPSSPTDVSN